MEFAKKLIGQDSKINSDLIVIAPEIEEKKGVTKKLDIKIETIRELQHKLSLTSSGGKYKAVIINDAERLNKTAQNALLKTLEEPNEKVVLILVAQDEKKMLPTIISRCQKIKFSMVSEMEIARIIPDTAENKEEILFWALGRPGLAIDLVNNAQELEFRKEALREFSGLCDKNIAEKFSLAEAWSKDMTALRKKLNLWTIILREAMLGKKSGIKMSAEKSFNLINGIAEALQIMSETNSNPRLILENLFLKF